MNYYYFSDKPSLYEDAKKYYSQGCSPKILTEFLNYLESNKNIIESIYGSVYLFNNSLLHNKFKELSSIGIEINIISIPMEGYDCNNPKPILDLNTGLPTYVTAKTKEDLAQVIYNEFINSSEIYPNYKLHIFPHMYLRSSKVNPFSRGNMPYSLHIKSFYIKFKNQGGTVAITSSNLAVRDLIKWDNMILIENEANCAIYDSAQKFYTYLIQQSIPIKTFDPSKDWIETSIALETYDFVPSKNPFVGNYYITPFYEDSPDMIEEKIIKLLQNAKERIYICAQHICAYEYSFKTSFKCGEKDGTTLRGGF